MDFMDQFSMVKEKTEILISYIRKFSIQKILMTSLR